MKKLFLSVLAFSALALASTDSQAHKPEWCYQACNHFTLPEVKQACIYHCRNCKQACAKGKQGWDCQRACNTTAQNSF